MEQKRSIMDEAAMNRAITRIDANDPDAYLDDEPARKKKLEEIEQKEVPMGILDITFYRDDLSLRSDMPVINGTSIDFVIFDKKIVLVDDVLYTGRTARAAMEAVMELGRAKKIELAVMVDRGHRELPIRADYVGKNVPTAKDEIIHVCFQDLDGVNSVSLEKNIQG